MKTPVFKPQVILTCLLLLTVACHEPQPLIDGPARPAMWEARGPAGRAILVGSIHALPPKVDWQGGRVQSAVALADELWLELAPAESAKAPALLDRMGRDEVVESLASRFGEARGDRIADLASTAGLDGIEADRMESWALALLIDAVSQNDAGFSGERGVETALTRAFTSAHKPVRGLETAARQLTILDDLPPPTQHRLVIQALQDRAGGPRRLIAMTRAWATGDEHTLAAITQEAMAAEPALRQPLLLSRNRAWAAALDGRLQKPGTVLVAVGVGHLVGEGSTIEELRSRGITVRRMQ